MVDTIELRLHSAFDTKPVFVKGVKHPLEVEHVCKGHYDLLQSLLTHKSKFFETTTFVEKTEQSTENLSLDDILHMEYTKNLQGHYLNKQIVRFKSANDVKERNLRTMGKMRVTSSESDIVFSINYDAGFIGFEFSIPKYLYQHNLAQFVPQGQSKFFSNPANRIIANSWECQISILYDRLIKFIKNFLLKIEKHFNLKHSIDLNFVEIIRIDLCFNQYFKNKEQALKTLEMQKKINNKYNRTSYQSNKPYDTSIAFKSRSKAFFKIYHKGSEYETVGDMKKHIKINLSYNSTLLQQKIDAPTFKTYKEEHEYLLEKAFYRTKEEEQEDKKKPIYIKQNVDIDLLRKFNKHAKNNQIFDIKFLHSEMNKVLRYEITIRPKYMAYHYKKNFFRKDCPYFKEYKKIHDKVRGIEDSRNTKKRKYQPSRYELDIYHDCKKWIQRSTSFMLTNSHSVKMFNKTSVGKGVNDYDLITKEYNITNVIDYQHSSSLNDKDVAIFSKELLEYLCYQFKAMFDHFQITELIKENDFALKLKQYNKKADENAERYNELYDHKTRDYKGNYIVKGSKVIKKATQLLTQKQLNEKHLKKVSVPVLTTLYEHLKEGYSLHEIREKLSISASSYCRYKQDLALFDINEQSQVIKEKIECVNDYSYYYDRQNEIFYRESFFVQEKYNRYA